MQEKMTRFIAPLILSAAFAGCTTTHGFDSDTCQAWTESSAELITTIGARNKIVQEAKASCKDGKAGAMVTLAGRSEDGKLLASSAIIGSTFIDIVEEKIRDGDDATRTYYTDVMDKYKYFLVSQGKIGIADVRKAAEEAQRAEQQAQQKTPSVCKGEGVFRSCSLK